MRRRLFGVDPAVLVVSFLALQWLDREASEPGAAGLPLASQRFPDPRDDGVIATVESVDLGPLPSDPAIPVEQVARAAVAVTALWALTRA